MGAQPDVCEWDGQRTRDARLGAQAVVELWPSGDSKKAKNSIIKGKAKHDLKAVGDFFEGEEDSGNEGTEVEQADYLCQWRCLQSENWTSSQSESISTPKSLRSI